VAALGERRSVRVLFADFRYAALVIETLRFGTVFRRPIESTQYTSEEFQRQLEGLGVTCSMSRSGNCWDHAVMESFFSTMQIERCHRTPYATREAARADLFDYIERFYHPIRRHSTLGNKSPVHFERAAVAELTVHATRRSSHGRISAAENSNAR